MNAPLGRLYAAKNAHNDRRRETRHPTCYEANLETSQGRRMVVRLADISLHGCCVHVEVDTLRQGAFVSIGLGEEPMLPAIVRWVRGTTSGMEFVRPIPPERIEWHDLMEFSLAD